MKLYEIGLEIRALIDKVDAAEGTEDALILEIELDGLQLPAEQKIDYLTKLILEQEAAAEVARLELKRVQSFAKSRENRAESLRKYLTSFLQTAGLRKFVTDVASISLLAGRMRLEIDITKVQDWPADIYDACVVERPEVNKKLLKDRFSARYSELAGVEEVVGETSISIR